MWARAGRLRGLFTAAVEVPASLVRIEGAELTAANLSFANGRMSRARNRMIGEGDPDPILESELRQGAGREWSEEAAEDERMTEKLRERRMELSGRMREFVARGQRVRAVVGSLNFSGTVVFAGTDYSVIDRDDDEVAVRLTSATWTLEPGGGGGHHQTGNPMSFKAHLAQLESSGEDVRFLFGDGRQMTGSVATVAQDSIVMYHDRTEVLDPLVAVIAVARPKPR